MRDMEGATRMGNGGQVYQEYKRMKGRGERCACLVLSSCLF